jgi:hypothetical protein
MNNKTIGEVVAEGRLKTFINRRLVKALGHPVREHILTVLNERVASPKEIGTELGLAVEDFYHHFEVLEELSCIECVRAERRRGATEHFFQATSSFLIEDEEWARFPDTLRSKVSVELVKPILADTVAAMEGGTFSAPDDVHVSWIPAHLDDRGRGEMMSLLNETMWRAMDIRDRSARRLSRSAGEGTPATVAILGFERPVGQQGEDDGATGEPAAARARGRHRASAR